jgi:bacillithiol system protein YtxJ
MIIFPVIVGCMIFLGCNLQPSERQPSLTNIGANMDWIVLNDESQLQDIINRSETRPQVIFKHSTRCSVSSVAKARLDRSSSPEQADFYFLDLIRYRNISNRIAEMFDVHHQSPQVLVIRNGVSVYDESHMGIDMEEIVDSFTH